MSHGQAVATVCRACQRFGSFGKPSGLSAIPPPSNTGKPSGFRSKATTVRQKKTPRSDMGRGATEDYSPC